MGNVVACASYLLAESNLVDESFDRLPVRARCITSGTHSGPRKWHKAPQFSQFHAKRRGATQYRDAEQQFARQRSVIVLAAVLPRRIIYLPLYTAAKCGAATGNVRQRQQRATRTCMMSCYGSFVVRKAASIAPCVDIFISGATA